MSNGSVLKEIAEIDGYAAVLKKAKALPLSHDELKVLRDFMRWQNSSDHCCFVGCTEHPCANTKWGPICNTHSYRLASQSAT